MIQKVIFTEESEDAIKGIYATLEGNNDSNDDKEYHKFYCALYTALYNLWYYGDHFFGEGQKFFGAYTTLKNELMFARRLLEEGNTLNVSEINKRHEKELDPSKSAGHYS